MAKTQLFARLQQLVRDQRIAKLRGIPAAAVRAQRAAVDAKRRQLLGGVGGGVAAALVPKPLRAALSEPRERIAIVGAGIAGLTCALGLAQRGIRATIYEANARVGGRMFSNAGRYWDNGQVSEWGGEFIDTGHTTIRRLARRFGLPLDDLLAASPRKATDTFFFDGDYYEEAEADHDFSLVYDRVQADLEAAPFPTTFDVFTPEAKALDHMTVYDWIESRIPGGHKTKLGQLLDVAYAAEYAADTTDQSALNILYLLGFQPDETGQTLEVFGESDERSHIRGGNDRLPRAIAAHLGEDAIEFGKYLAAIKRTSHGAYDLTFDAGRAASTIRADLVVLALPFAVLRGLDFADAGFDAMKQRAIMELGRGHTGKLQLQCKSRFWEERGPWGISTGSSFVDTGYMNTWDVTRAQPGKTGILVFYSGGSVTDAMRTDTAFALASNPRTRADAVRTLKQAEPVFPGVTGEWNDKATLSLWHFNPLAQLSYSYYRIGQYTDFGGYEKAPQGGVFFCGEHTSTDFQGFMEGGASEGERAAREVAKAVLGKVAA